MARGHGWYIVLIFQCSSVPTTCRLTTIIMHDRSTTRKATFCSSLLNYILWWKHLVEWNFCLWSLTCMTLCIYKWSLYYCYLDWICSGYTWNLVGNTCICSSPKKFLPSAREITSPSLLYPPLKPAHWLLHCTSWQSLALCNIILLEVGVEFEHAQSEW